MPGVALPAGDGTLESRTISTQHSGGTCETVSTTTRFEEGGYFFLSQSDASFTCTAVVADAAAFVAATFALNRSADCGSTFASLAHASSEIDGVLHGCDWKCAAR